jgi:hypothetical protein
LRSWSTTSRATIEAKYNGTAIYTASYPAPDGLGRIKGKTETIPQEQPVSTTYGYDAAGRLSSAGVISYEYDGNGNRIKVGGVTKGNYDSRDRVRVYDGIDYTYNAAGESIRVPSKALMHTSKH